MFSTPVCCKAFIEREAIGQFLPACMSARILNTASRVGYVSPAVGLQKVICHRVNEEFLQ